VAEIRQFPARQFVEVSADEWLESHSEIARCLRALISSLRIVLESEADNFEIIRRSERALEKVGA
jgi:hypothetical protein